MGKKVTLDDGIRETGSVHPGEILCLFDGHMEDPLVLLGLSWLSVSGGVSEGVVVVQLEHETELETSSVLSLKLQLS